MLRSAADKIMWVGRGTVFLVGLVAILALAFAVVNAVLGATGGPSLSGKFNQIDPITQLVGSDAAADQALNVEPVARRRQIELPRGYAQVGVNTPTPTLSGAKGVRDVARHPSQVGVYCFDLTFTPKTAVASANINNNATVGTALGSGVPSGCPTGFEDAAAKTHAANDSTARSDINFGIVFI